MYEFMQKLFNLNRDLDNDASFIKKNVLIWNFVTQTLHVPWIGPSVSILCEDHPLLKLPSSSPLLSLYTPHKNREGPDVPMNFSGYISVYIRGGEWGGRALGGQAHCLSGLASESLDYLLALKEKFWKKTVWLISWGELSVWMLLWKFTEKKSISK